MTYIESLTAWVLSVMIAMQPAAPWRATYPTTAAAFAKVAIEEPLFAGADGARKTAALFASVGWFEGSFDPAAKGDCRKQDAKGRCLGEPQSLCTMQIGVSNLTALGVTEEQILGDIETCTRSARRLMSVSFGVCRGREEVELLGQYASGHGVCGGLEKSRHRMLKAKWIVGKFPLEKPAQD